MISLSLLGWAIVATCSRWHDVGWASLLGGLAIGLSLSLIFFAPEGWAGAMSSLSRCWERQWGTRPSSRSCSGSPSRGGLLSVAALLRGQRDLAYMPAIALGLFLFLLWSERPDHATAW